MTPAVILWAGAAGAVDLIYRRLPNILTLGGLVVALAFLVFFGVSPLGASAVAVAEGVVIALVLTMPGYLMRSLGAGDVKFLLAIAAFGGLKATLVCFVLAALLMFAPAVLAFLAPRFGLPPINGKHLPFGTTLAAGFILALAGGQVGDLS